MKINQLIAIPFLVGLLCVACSRETDDIYHDPWADPDVKIGRQIFKDVESADKHDGRYSVHKYEFKGKGPAHKMLDVQRFGLDREGSRGSDVSAQVHIEWPEKESGLTKDALAKVRKTILWMAFAFTPEVTPYSVPESLGETEETLRKRNKELWAEEGVDREIDEYGLQPADWGRLVGDALSHKAGRIPAKDDGRVTTKALKLGISGIEKYAMSCYKCQPPEKGSDHWWHRCSQWTFIVGLHLDWPFGVAENESAEWFERPVLCVWNDGYDIDGGHGCHSCYCSKVFSLPDGKELGIEDYFSPDKLQALSVFVTERFYNKYCDEVEGYERSEEPLDLASDEVSMLVTKEGVKWTWSPYSIRPGCDGMPSIFIKWQELEVFLK